MFEYSRRIFRLNIERSPTWSVSRPKEAQLSAGRRRKMLTAQIEAIHHARRSDGRESSLITPSLHRTGRRTGWRLANCAADVLKPLPRRIKTGGQVVSRPPQASTRSRATNADTFRRSGVAAAGNMVT